MSAEYKKLEKSQEKRQLLKEKSLKELGLYGEFIAAFIAPVKEKTLEALLKDEKFKKTLTPERRLQLAINVIDACITLHNNDQFICTIGQKDILVEPDTLKVKIVNGNSSSRVNNPISTKEADIYFIAEFLLIPILAGKNFGRFCDENGVIYYESHPVTAEENKILGKTITESFNIRKKRLVPLLNELRAEDPAEDPAERDLLEKAKEELSTILTFVRQLEGTEKVKSNKSVFWLTPDSLTDQTHHQDKLRELSGLRV